jgi:hypothetical protein
MANDVTRKTFMQFESIYFKLILSIWQSEFMSLLILLMDLESWISLESDALKILVLELLGPNTIRTRKVELEMHVLPEI